VATGIPARLSVREGRRFGLTLGGAFLVIAGVLAWRGRPVGSLVAATLGAALLLGALVMPTRLGPVERAWMGLAHLLNRLTTPVFLGVVYFGVIFPIGVLVRKVRGNPLTRPPGHSYWVSRPPAGRRSDLQRQF